MHFGELLLLLVGSLAVTGFARWRGLPAPLLVMAAAFIVSIIPGMPKIIVDGDLVLTAVLPPLLYSAALDGSFLNFRQSARQIRRLGLGLILGTALVVGLVAYWIMPSLTLPGALLLGAIVSPPDAISAAAVGRKLGLPRRVMTVISGESLVNDAAALTLFKVFGALVAGVTVTWLGGVWEFILAVGIGVGLGYLIGAIVHLLRMKFDDPVLLGTMGLLVPYAAYTIAETLSGSGVLAVVTAGLYIGFHAPLTDYETRQQEKPIWLSLDLLLEGVVFALIGLQLKAVLTERASGPEFGISLVLAVAVLVTVLLIRPVWVFGGYFLSRRLDRLLERIRKLRHPDEAPRKRGEPELSARELTVISWAGMRGVVTLATATAMPAIVAIPESDHGKNVVFLAAFVVTVSTLLLQGLTLPMVVRKLGVTGGQEREQDRKQVQRVLRQSAEAGRAFLADKRPEWNMRFGEDIADPVFDNLTARLARLEAGSWQEFERNSIAAASDGHERLTSEHIAQLFRAWLAARRRVILDQRDAGKLDEEVMRELMLALDAEEFGVDTLRSVRGYAVEQEKPRE